MIVFFQKLRIIDVCCLVFMFNLVQRSGLLTITQLNNLFS